MTSTFVNWRERKSFVQSLLNLTKLYGLFHEGILHTIFKGFFITSKIVLTPSYIILSQTQSLSVII